MTRQAATAMGWERWVLPGVAVMLFALNALLMFEGNNNFLTDPGTARHLYAGRLLYDTGAIPRTDPFNWQEPALPWIDFEWGFEAIAVGLQRAGGGLALPYAFGFLLYGLIGVLFWRMLIGRRIDWPVALLYVCGMLLFYRIHLLLRPLLFTYVFMLVFVMWYGARPRGPGLAGWIALPLMTMVWANIHGGFTAAFVFLGAALAGRVIENRLDGRPLFDAGVRAWAGLGVVAAAATLVNPHGWHLHALVLKMVFAIKSFKYWDEFTPPDFAAPSATALAVLLVVFTLLAGRAVRGSSRPSWELLLPVLVFLYFGLKVQRHVLLLLIVAAVPVCRDWQVWARALGAGALLDRVTGFGRMERASRSHWWQIPLVAVAAAALFAASPAAGELRVGHRNLSPEALDYLREHKEQFRHPLTSTWPAGAVAYYLAPDIRVSHDDRTEHYCDAVFVPYIDMLNLADGWKKTLAEGGYDSAILEHGFALTQALPELKAEGWERVYSDETVALFVKKPSKRTQGVPQRTRLIRAPRPIREAVPLK